VRIRAGRPLLFPTARRSSPALASAVTDRIWACVRLQWDWLGGVRALPARPPREGAAHEVSRAA
jgi:hypothetical protein